MKYILDFDHTLFNTTDFVARVSERGMFDILITPQIWEHFNVMDFLYADTLTFLESKNRADLIILTAMTPTLGPQAREFQKQKLNSGNFDKYVEEIIFMEGDKGPHIADLFTGQPTTFVDDSLPHLISSRKCCPEVICAQMVRFGEETWLDISEQKDISVVHTLDELE